MLKLSVIIPVYNVAPYIDRCVCSLFEQTLHDIEFIFIDDCTPDNSMDIIYQKYEEYKYLLFKRNNIVRIYKMEKNSGIAAVRHKGILLATGDYIIHCDSDDWIDSTLYEEMYNKAIADNADVVICPIRDEYSNNGVTRPIVSYPIECREVLKSWYKCPVGMFFWNKIVRRTIYLKNNIFPFEGVNMWEDNALFLRVFYYAKRLSYTKKSVYHYNQSNMSAMTSGYGRGAIDQMIICAYKLDDFFKSKPDYKDFEKTNNAVKFLAKLNLVTNHFSWLKDFYGLFPESNSIVRFIPKESFSKRGYIRFCFVKYKLAWLFVLLFKIQLKAKKCLSPFTCKK